MKTFKRGLAILTVLTIGLGTVGAALSQAIAITTGSPTIQVNGTSGGSKKDNGCAGYVSSSPNHVIQVAEDSNLNFTLQAEGQPTLLIRGTAGSNFCVPATSDSAGKITIPGRWAKGTYSVYVGDRANGHYPYTLSISRS